MREKEQSQNNLEAIDITVLASEYVQEFPPPEQDGLVTDANGNVLGAIQPVIVGNSEGGRQIAWSFRPKENR